VATSDETVARIGPNAVLQTLTALEQLEGAERRESALRRARIEPARLTGMVPEAWFLAMIRAVRDLLPPARADAVLRLAGTYTADYVAENRIPRFFRSLLAVLPARVGIPLLLAAFRRHAWTFAGSGRFSVEGGYPGTLVLDQCPTCRLGTSRLPAGAYYEAAFEGLLHIVDARVRVREFRCRSVGDPSCQFAIELSGQTVHGEPSCASY
jgi:divinyl protochlorophyllide a 8-vinyl-reductase